MIDLFRGRNSLPMIFQKEVNECGLACLAMIASHHGKRIDIRTLRGRFRMSPLGASVKQLLAVAGEIDLEGRPLKLELGDLRKLTLPVILHWDLDHFVVLKKVGRGSIVIHDPAIGIRKYREGEIGIHFTGVAVELYPRTSFKKETLTQEYSLKQLFQATPSFYRSIRQVFLISIFLQLLALLSPLYLQLVIDQGLAHSDMDMILLVAVLFFIVVLAKTVVSYFRGLILLQFSNQLGFQLVGTTFSHLLRLPLAFFEKREMGDIVSRFSSLENIKQLVTQEMITVVVDGMFSLVTIIILFLYSPLLAAVALGFVASFTLVRFLSIPVERLNRQQLLEAGAKQQSRFMENIRSIAVTKNYAMEQQRLAEWQGSYADYINSGYHLGKFQLGIGSAQALLFGIDHIVTIFLGSSMVLTGDLTLGQLMSFIFLKQHFSGSITAMLPKLTELRLMKLELERVSDIVLEEEESHSSSSSLLKRSVKGKLEVRNLNFSYSDVDQPVFQNLCCSIDQGRCLAITGRSGCGKSTLLKLMLGLEVPQSGKVLVDELSLKEFGIGDYRDQIAAVMHRDDLLSGDLAYNINLDTEPSNENRLQTACQRAGIAEVIRALPMGFRTQVGEMGVGLSAGQIQRLLLARALYRLPKILILDEALSHLSDELAAELLTNIKQMNITIIIVTHNPVLLRLADQRLQLGSL